MQRSLFALCVVWLALGCGDDDVVMGVPTGGSGGTGGTSGAGGTSGGGGSAGTGGDAELVSRGQYLVNNVIGCPDCHTPRNAMGAPIADQYLAGAECFVQLENEACLHSRNLTNDETGLANRTDDEIKKMIRDGIRPSSTGDVALSPVMPYYVFHNITDADMNAIVAYLRTVPAVAHEVPRSAMVFEVPAPANYLTDAAIPMPMDGYAEMERALRGRYLATESGACIECHTKHIQGDPNVIDYTKFFAGGEEYAIGLPTVPIAKNLTSDTETGLGSWTPEEIVAALLEGKDKDGAGICPPMPVQPMAPYTGLDPEDALDIAHYIKSLPPIVNAIDDVCTFPPM